MEAKSASQTVVIDGGIRRDRAKARLYVIFQVGGWGFFWLFQGAVTAVGFGQKRSPTLDEQIFQWSITTMVMALGLLLTHYGRRVIERGNWKALGWRTLTPCVLALSAVEATLWIAVGFGWPYLVLQKPWPSPTPWSVAVGIVWFNGFVTLVGWHCIYFFYHLFDRFNRLEIERLRLAANVKEAELRALKSQVNPHFIFNSLNSLRALIDENPARAREAVTQLANLLRYSLQSAQSETVAFEDELRVVNDYLALEQVRHEERLQVKLDIAPETLGFAVPPLLLQTLVENAVKYGISQRPEGGEIVIIARCVDGQLHLRVINPGELSTVGQRQSSGGSTGLGLKNAAERLRMFFGETARLELRAESGSRVVAEVLIPLQMTRA